MTQRLQGRAVPLADREVPPAGRILGVDRRLLGRALHVTPGRKPLLVGMGRASLGP